MEEKTYRLISKNWEYVNPITKFLVIIDYLSEKLINKTRHWLKLFTHKLRNLLKDLYRVEYE